LVFGRIARRVNDLPRALASDQRWRWSNANDFFVFFLEKSAGPCLTAAQALQGRRR
jgi:hypothetical protein